MMVALLRGAANRLQLGLGLALLPILAPAQDLRSVSEPVAPPSCSVLRAGIPGQDDTERIQHAIDLCPAGQAVRLSAHGKQRAFLAGPLQLRSGVSLSIDDATTLYASSEARRYDRGAGRCGSIDRQGTGCKPFITAEHTHGSGIYGAGSIDGQGGQLMAGGSASWWQLARRAQQENARQNVPRLIEVTASQAFTLHQITLRNAPNFHVTLKQVDGFTAWGVRIDTPATARNTDGIDPISSRNITIAYSQLRTGDDHIAIKAGSNGPSEHISILHNQFYNGHGLSIGSETEGGVRHVLVEDLSIDGSTSGLRIKSDVSRGGHVQHVIYRDICLRNVQKPIDFDTHYLRTAQGTKIPLYTDLLLDGVQALTPGRVILQGYDSSHLLQATLRSVSVAGYSDQPHWQQIAYAQLDGAVASTVDQTQRCTGKFNAFPETASAIPTISTTPATSATSTRPQLSPQQARQFAYAEVLKYVVAAGKESIDRWDPLTDPLALGAPFVADYTVDPSGLADGLSLFNTVQGAINRAVHDSVQQPARRRYLLLKPGVYQELVYLPAGTAPITVYGEGKDASATRISASLDAAISGVDYAARHGAQFAQAPAAVQAMYASIKDRPQIGTFGSATVWVQAHGFQARNLSIENAYNKDTGNAGAEALPKIGNIHHQALALQVDGVDRAQFENIRLLGFQDTLYLKAPQIGTSATTARSFFNNSYIEGDVDFIFGDSTAYFYQTEIKSLGDRGLSYVAAPDTHLNTRYGFVFDHCRFTHDGSAHALSGKFYLARQWFHGARCTPYAALAQDGYACTLGPSNGYQAPRGTIAKVSLEAVGKMVVLNSRLGAHINRQTPWSDWNRPGTLAYRPVQYHSTDYWNYLRQAGIDMPSDPGTATTAAPATTQIFLGEYNNSND